MWTLAAQYPANGREFESLIVTLIIACGGVYWLWNKAHDWLRQRFLG